MNVQAALRVAVAGLDPRDARLIEIVFRHSQYNRFQFRLVQTVEADGMDLLVANTTAPDGLAAVARLRAMRSEIPVIAAVPRGATSSARYSLSIERLTLQLLPILNRVVEHELVSPAARASTPDPAAQWPQHQHLPATPPQPPQPPQQREQPTQPTQPQSQPPQPSQPQQQTQQTQQPRPPQSPQSPQSQSLQSLQSPPPQPSPSPSPQPLGASLAAPLRAMGPPPAPARETQPAPAPNAPAPTGGKLVEFPRNAEWTGQRIRVLVVDDSPTVRQQLSIALNRMGLACDAVDGAAAAHEKLREAHYDLALVDVVMRDVDGYRLTRDIRRSHRATPVIILTSKSSPFDLARGALAGCKAYLVKPVPLRKLEAAVTKILRKSLAIDDLAALMRPIPRLSESPGTPERDAGPQRGEGQR